MNNYCDTFVIMDDDSIRLFNTRTAASDFVDEHDGSRITSATKAIRIMKAALMGIHIISNVVGVPGWRVYSVYRREILDK